MDDVSPFRCRHTTDPAVFLDRAGGFLLAHPVENSPILSAASALAGSPPAGSDPTAGIWSWSERGSQKGGGQVVSAAQYVLPRSVYLTSGPAPAIEGLAELFLRVRPEITGVEGPADAVEAFVAVWCAGREVVARPGMAKGVYVAGDVIRPEAVPGRMRRATEDDLSRLRPWGEAFLREADLATGALPDVVTVHVREGRASVWEVEGVVVSMVVVTEPRGGVSRIQLVYTPHRYRGHGYASACVAEVTAREQESPGRICMLYTDLANTTTNRIYPEVGYRRIGDVAEVRFVGRSVSG
jgi:predicted GNAT family acetyltransferase